jgi:hypothetical protein
MSETASHVKLVHITLDERPAEIPPGEYTLPEFKKELRIDDSKVVEEFVKGRFVTLGVDDKITPKNGDKFATHVQRGGSS